MTRFRSRLRLAASSGALVLGLTVGSGGVQAQSFNATATPALGTPSIATGVGSTTIVINDAETIIDWNASAVSGPSPFIFQNAGTSATFTVPGSVSPITDYTVLNRISLSDPLSGAAVLRPVQFNGSVTSTLSGNVAGNIWFYSPTGIIAGAGSVFNVGSLVLTTDAIDTTGGLYGTGNSIRFRGTAASTGFVNVNAGATLNTTNSKVTGQYVALVAPRVVQGGTITANGQIALVAAEQADISINAGLLDIAIAQGTTDANGIVHTGTSTGGATSSSANQQIIQMIAMPKNTALTMLLSGNIGYTPAALASNEGSAVVLSAGYASYVPTATQALGLGNMTIADATISNALTARATDTISVKPNAGSSVAFQADASLGAGKRVDVISDDSTGITAAGKLDIKAGLFEAGGTVNLRALNTVVGNPAGAITVNDGLTVDASAASDATLPIGITSADAAGGNVLIEAQGGKISAAAMTVNASAASASALTTAGNAGGGKIIVATGNGGSISGNNVDFQANGLGGSADSQGGRGRGGVIALQDQGGSLNFNNVNATAVGLGGVANKAGGTGGDGLGGAIAVDIQGKTAGWSRIVADASAFAGLSLVDGTHSGNALADNEGIRIHVGNAANFYVQGDVLLNANAIAGVDGTPGNTFADAGGITVLVDGKATLYSGGTSLATGNIVAHADARVDGQTYRTNALYTPDALGGLVTITADGGTIRLDHIYATATAEGAAAGTTAGKALGGSIQAGSINQGLLSVFSTAPGNPLDPLATGNLTLDVGARGAAGPSSANATGGTASLFIQNGAATVSGATTLKADASAGLFDGRLTGGAFTARGGSASLVARSGIGTGSITLAGVNLSANGTNDGTAGEGQGGTAQVIADGDLISALNLNLSANGTGSGSGAGTGGTASLLSANGGTIGAFNTGLTAAGQGGASLLASGNGTGGTVSITDTGGTLDLGAVTLTADGVGGNSVLGGGTAGDGFGGRAAIDINLFQPIWTSLAVNARAFAGEGLGSGTTGGSAIADPNAIKLRVGSGGSLTIDSAVTLDATATGAFNAPVTAAARGGGISVVSEAGASLESIGRLTANASALISPRGYNPAVRTAPTVTGGTVSILADTGASLRVVGLDALARAEGAGVNTAAGSATGGSAQVGAAGGGQVSLGDSDVLLDAGALGSGGPGKSDAFGGTARLYAQGGTITSSATVRVLAQALSSIYDLRLDGTGFNATGGTARVDVLGAGTTGQITVQNLVVDASGQASDPGGTTPSIVGNGGTGRGGSALVNVAADQLGTGTLLIQADGKGGNSAPGTGSGWQSGDGQGGVASLTQSGGTITATGALTINAVGRGGGDPGPADIGQVISGAGKGVGGNASLTISGGSLSGNGLTIDAGGLGGTGQGNFNGVITQSAGSGGEGRGGSASLTMPTGSTSASLAIASGTIVHADGQGGDGGVSGVSNLQDGQGGDSFGGIARIALADGLFSFNDVDVSGTGALARGPYILVDSTDPVTGLPTVISVQTFGNATAGNAGFDLVDSVVGPAGRKVQNLTLTAKGLGFGGTNPLTRLRSSVLSPAAAMAITANLLVNTDAYDPVINGFEAQIDGSDLSVQGGASIFGTSGILINVAAGQRFAARDFLSMRSGGGTITTNGLLRSGGLSQIFGQSGVVMTDLESGDQTSLLAPSGPVVVSHNLLSVGPVIASGQSIDITSLGALSFTTATATAGNLAIRTAANLDTTAVSATGTVALTSDTGALHSTGSITGNGITLKATGNVLTDAAVTSGGALAIQAGGNFTAGAPVSAAGNVAIDALQGISAARLVSGGTTALSAANGAIAITTDLTSPGAVSASGRSVDLVSTGPLAFTALTATAGNATVTAAGNITLANASASGALSLTSTGGSVGSTGTLTGGSATVQGATGITLKALQSGGATSLQAPGGTLTVQALSSTGPVSAAAQSIAIQSPGALAFAAAQASAGNLAIQTAGNLDTPAIAATGSTSLTSTGGAIHATGPVTGAGVTLTAGGNIATDAGITSGGALTVQAGGTFTGDGTTSAAGNTSLTGTQGVTAARIVSGGTTTLGAANGAIAVTTDLTSPGAVSASGRSISLVSTGALTFSALNASAGNASVLAAGTLTVPNASASGALGLTSSGGAVNSTGTLTSGGNLAISGNTGVALNTVQSGGTTSLQSALGNVAVAALTSAGPVSAQGRAVSIQSPGALTFAQAQATAGDLLIRTAGDLTVGTVDAGGAVTLTSTGGALAATGAISGTDVLLDAGSTLSTAALNASGTLQASSVGAMTIGGDATAGGGLNLLVTAGTLTTRKLGAAVIGLNARDGIQIDGAQSRGNLTATTKGMFRIRGFTNGTAITVTSADIDLGTFNLGQRGFTQSITLQNSQLSNQTFVGGATTTTGYSLSTAEMLQLFADKQITIKAPDAGSPADMVVGDLQLTYGNNLAASSRDNLGAGGTFKLVSGGNIVVQGAVNLHTVSAGDTFAIDPVRIDIVTDAGSIGMLSAGNAPLGTLSLVAGSIRVANAATLTALGSAGSLAATNTLLDAPASNPRASGYLVAGSIAFDVTQGLFIQNTGLTSSYADRRGFTAGNVSIRTGGSATQIAINGQTLDPAGIVVTGLNTVRTLVINGLVPALGGSFDPLSSVNGCVIGLDCTVIPGLRPDKNDLIRPLSPDGTGGGMVVIPLITIVDQHENGSPPLIDEPITGVGNDDLWQDGCEQGQSCKHDSAGQAGNRGTN